jgi:hypothetical protein
MYLKICHIINDTQTYHIAKKKYTQRKMFVTKKNTTSLLMQQYKFITVAGSLIWRISKQRNKKYKGMENQCMWNPK